jgi:hypothetical protein
MNKSGSTGGKPLKFLAFHGRFYSVMRTRLLGLTVRRFLEKIWAHFFGRVSLTQKNQILLLQ